VQFSETGHVRLIVRLGQRQGRSIFERSCVEGLVLGIVSVLEKKLRFGFS
jgi:hypothetical protein